MITFQKLNNLGLLYSLWSVICGLCFFLPHFHVPYLFPKSISLSVLGISYRQGGFGVCIPSQINNLLQTCSKSETAVVTSVFQILSFFLFFTKCKLDINMLSSAKVLKRGSQHVCTLLI